MQRIENIFHFLTPQKFDKNVKSQKDKSALKKKIAKLLA